MIVETIKVKGLTLGALRAKLGPSCKYLYPKYSVKTLNTYKRLRKISRYR